ncbi:hypothetical protein BCT26_19205 [Vibrio lentus]|nr:hypothetical protein BCU96_22360 [Vibrio lentus]PMH13935.1 hypothetical protein BCU76_01545 [Vibrio lentus]PMJ08398.1 hypothetical protein BCU30_07975 [Vibrio lentus]PMK86026.1 hypothetical protein BCT89_08075 [Vibrio lentus]PMN13227.1 hypothetical protein BCT39_23820 [Vibrio lentus]
MRMSEQRKQIEELNSRIGWVTELHLDSNKIKIDFENNPLGQPIWGSIGRAFTMSDIELAIDNQLDCRIEFFSGDLNLPILIDVYTSLISSECLIFRSKKMQIQGEEEVVIRSGEAQITMTAKNGSVKTAATHINSTAEKMQKIQATKITLN